MTATETTPAKERWRAQWAELFTEVVTSGLCTGCAGCVVACPHDVLGYDDTNGVYRPFHLEDELGPGDCGHGLRGCTSCTRACPRFRNWETEIDSYLFGREREPDEMDGVSKDIFLARAADPELHERGQDGGLVSAILLWCLENDRIDAALVSLLEGDGSTWKAVPGLARTREEILAAAGSRYTYSANTLAYIEAVQERRRAPGPGRHELPGLDPGRHASPQSRQGRAAAWPCRSACCARRPSTTPSSTSCSRPSTGWRGRTSSR